MTVDEYLAAWLARQRTQLQPSTWKTYGDTIRRYLSPTIGAIGLGDLDPLRVEQSYTELFAHGGKDGARLSVGTLRYIHAVLHKALADAVRLRMLDVNVTDFVQLPRRRSEDPSVARLRVWSAEEAQTFLRLVRGDRLYPLWATALRTGMRRGELLGLSWSDVDVHSRTIRVHRSLTTIDGRPELKSTKTGRPRTLCVDTQSIAELAAWRERQWSERRDGSRHCDWDPVFTDETGASHLPMRITSTFRRLVRRLPVPTLRLHDVRHTHASLLLQAGVSIKVVSERLGHRSIALTMDTYTHVLPAMDRQAADRFGDLLTARWPEDG